MEARKQELAKEEKELNFPELAVVQANLTREQLAEWDASARAWWRTADLAKNRQQTQLRLIIDNVSISVNDTANAYDSVLEA